MKLDPGTVRSGDKIHFPSPKLSMNRIHLAACSTLFLPKFSSIKLDVYMCQSHTPRVLEWPQGQWWKHFTHFGRARRMRLESTSNISSSTEGAGVFISSPRTAMFSGREGRSVIICVGLAAGNINEKRPLSGSNGVSSGRPCAAESVLNISQLDSSWYQLPHTHSALDSFLALEWSVYVG